MALHCVRLSSVHVVRQKMSAPISKLEYLKKYMSGAEAQKKDGKVKKKKLKQVVKAKG